MCMQEFHIALQQNNVQQQHEVLGQCQETSSFTAEHMLKLAVLSQHTDKSSLNITQEAYTAALKLLLSRGHSVQYEHVAQASVSNGMLPYKAMVTPCSTCVVASVQCYYAECC